LYVYFFLVRKS